MTPMWQMAAVDGIAMAASSKPLRVAAVQAESVAGDVERNVATAAAGWRRLPREGARLVVLPELFIPGYDPETLAQQAGPGRRDADDRSARTARRGRARRRR